MAATAFCIRCSTGLLPGWNLFRGQERAAYLVALGLSVLAGYGALAIQVMPQRSRSWWATAFAALAIGATYLFGLLWQLPGRTAISQGQFLAVAATDGDACLRFRRAAAHARLEPATLALAGGAGNGQSLCRQHGHQ